MITAIKKIKKYLSDNEIKILLYAIIFTLFCMTAYITTFLYGLSILFGIGI